MSEGDIQIILHRLDQLEQTLKEIHSEVRRTNGRVTELEKDAARAEGIVEARETQNMTTRNVVAYVASGGILGILAWFVGHSIN